MLIDDKHFIAHFPGKGKALLPIVQDFPKVKVDDRIQIVTFCTPNLDKPILIKQLEESGINYLNPVADYKGEWNMLLKMDTFKDLKIDKPYTLLIDSVDTVLLRDLPVLKTYGKILYNSSSCLHPKKDEETPVNGRYFNAGICFGPTELMQSIYSEASKISHEEATSEQHHLRKYFDTINWRNVSVDYWENYFLNTHLGEHKLDYLGNNNYRIEGV